MSKKVNDKLKLGLFVIAGGVFLIILLYMIGRKENLFGNTFLLRARFTHVQGLLPGNNVRFAGIQVGTGWAGYSINYSEKKDVYGVRSVL